MTKYVIGIDYGTDSCRAVLTDTRNGHEIDSEVFYYPRWQKELYCDASKSQFRQHPLDYIESLTGTIKKITDRADKDVVDNIVAISVDTTGSTICAVDEAGQPLSLNEGFGEDPDAMFVL